MKLNPRTFLVQSAEALLHGELLGWIEGYESWEAPITALLDFEISCLLRSMGKTATYPLSDSPAKPGWELVQKRVRVDGLTWLEAASILHNIGRGWLHMALRGERHPDDPDKKADEA